jgi:hypothetical protein
VQLYFQDVPSKNVHDMDCRTALAEYFRKHKRLTPVRDGRRDASRDIID